jgi:FtsP/CotA-like multicopper oxidase with cupredoxin domain
MIDAGVRETISLEFRKMKDSSPDPSNNVSPTNEAYVRTHCTGEPLVQHVIAADGLTLAAVKLQKVLVFQPGYRWDSLLTFPESGRYCVINAEAAAGASVSNLSTPRQLLGIVEVLPSKPLDRPATVHVTDELVRSAERLTSGPVKERVVKDLKNGLKLSAFTPHPDVRDDEVTGYRELTFHLERKSSPPEFQVNGRPYDAARIDQQLTLGSVDEWSLRAGFLSHPFHIHVNPFQVVRILDPSGRDVSSSDAVDDAGGVQDSQYVGLKGVWKDTLWIKSLNPPQETAGSYTVIVRTRYERYTGDFVLHCHILDHEDQGMMQNVRIERPRHDPPRKRH